MPDVKISALPASTTPLAGTEVLPIVQSATTRQVSVANLTAGRSVGGTNFIPSGSSVPTNGLYLPAANSLGFSTNSTNRATIDASGNLGLGTTPSAWGVTAPAIELPNFAISSLSNTGYLNSNSYFNTSNNFVYKNTAAATLLSMGTSGYQFNIAPSGTAGATISFTQAMTLDANGNLGVGSTTPSATGLDTGTTRLFVVAPNSNVGGALTTVADSIGRNYYFSDATKTYKGFLDIASGGIAFGSASSIPLNFYTSGAEKMRITSAGDVGIGTSSPASKLHVSTSSGGVQVRATSDSDVSFFALSTGADSTALVAMANDARQWTLRINGAESDQFQIRDSTAGANRLTINSSGIVTMGAYGAGAATFDASGVISSVSDETWKTKDGVPTNPDVMLQKLEPGYWFYNDEKKETFSKDRQLGFYAQNVHEAIGEEAAPTPQEGKPWGYYDRSVLAVAVMSLKNALTTIEELKQRIATLENK